MTEPRVYILFLSKCSEELEHTVLASFTFMLLREVRVAVA